MNRIGFKTIQGPTQGNSSSRLAATISARMLGIQEKLTSFQMRSLAHIFDKPLLQSLHISEQQINGVLLPTVQCSVSYIRYKSNAESKSSGHYMCGEHPFRQLRYPIANVEIPAVTPTEKATE